MGGMDVGGRTSDWIPLGKLSDATALIGRIHLEPTFGMELRTVTHVLILQQREAFEGWEGTMLRCCRNS